MPPTDRPPMRWREDIARWPESAREAWGLRANVLLNEGMANWPEDERQAANEVRARLRAGEFRGDVPPPPPVPATPMLWEE